MDAERWRQQLQEEKKLRDLFFASDPQSPLPPQDRRAFQELAYWPPDPECRFELELDEYEDREVIRVADTGGQERNLWRWGEFRFRLEGQQCALQAYKPGFPGWTPQFMYNEASFGRPDVTRAPTPRAVRHRPAACPEGETFPCRSAWMRSAADCKRSA